MKCARRKKKKRGFVVFISVVLFGSRAKGTAKEHSDYDFFVIVTNLPESKERDKISLELGRYVGRRYYKSVQIHLTAEKELDCPINRRAHGERRGVNYRHRLTQACRAKFILASW